MRTKQDLTPAVRFFVDLSDGRRPVKFEIIREGYLPPFEPGPGAAGVTALEPADLMATKSLANADRGLDRALRFRDFFDLVMAASEWPQQAPLAMEKAVGAYRESAMSSVEKVADLLREEAYGRLAMSDKARVLIDQVLGSSSPGTISRIFGR